MTTDAHDPATLAFYDAEAVPYAARRAAEGTWALDGFLTRLGLGARILELGCGGGQDAAVMVAAGFDVTPTDGSPGLAEVAERRLGRPVRVMRFDELDDVAAYDAVWANACLLHVPEDALSDVLRRVHTALVPGGLFQASFKAGSGGGRDSLGRYYNFPSAASLEAAYRAAGPWTVLEFTASSGGGYDGVQRDWLLVSASK
ncbi:hypothetical protein sos41_38000 [Alphaproteobacteria bacterium SO-S41]|nr:hypothetical protein sos41_38000 [Alphaproteobacteria bacterium SO-S41]